MRYANGRNSIFRFRYLLPNIEITLAIHWTHNGIDWRWPNHTLQRFRCILRQFCNIVESQSTKCIRLSLLTHSIGSAHGLRVCFHCITRSWNYIPNDIFNVTCFLGELVFLFVTIQIILQIFIRCFDIFLRHCVVYEVDQTTRYTLICHDVFKFLFGFRLYVCIRNIGSIPFDFFVVGNTFHQRQ